MESKEIKIMRDMAWERGKGELRSILGTFYSSSIITAASSYDKYSSALKKFIAEIEDEGLLE